MTGLYESVTITPDDRRQLTRFGGWVACFWIFALGMFILQLLAVIGDGRVLLTIFETPRNAMIMRVVLWAQCWFWAPFLILAPLGHRLTPAVTIVTVLISTMADALVVTFLLDLDLRRVIAINAFNLLLLIVVSAYFLFSRRAAALAESTRPVDSRARRHFALLVLVAGSLSIVIFGADPSTAIDRVSFLTAWQFTLLLAVVLSVGPLRTIRTGRTPVSNMMRRDLGIWTGITGLLHVYAGFGESMSPLYVTRYINILPGNAMPFLRRDLFMWGVIVGLIATVLLLVLLVLSNDASMMRIGKRWWKRVHRASYIIFVLVLLHGAAFQYLEGRHLILCIVFALLGMFVLGVQVAGYVAVRTKRKQRRERHLQAA